VLYALLILFLLEVARLGMLISGSFYHNIFYRIIGMTSEELYRTLNLILNQLLFVGCNIFKEIDIPAFKVFKRFLIVCAIASNYAFFAFRLILFGLLLSDDRFLAAFFLFGSQLFILLINVNNLCNLLFKDIAFGIFVARHFS